MLSENQSPATNWDMVLFKKSADVEDAAKEFEEKIPKEFKAYFQKKPEETQFFIILLSLLSDEERQQLKDDLGAGKARNKMMTGHDLAACIEWYDIFSGKASPKEGEII